MAAAVGPTDVRWIDRLRRALLEIIRARNVAAVVLQPRIEGARSGGLAVDQDATFCRESRASV